MAEGPQSAERAREKSRVRSIRNGIGCYKEVVLSLDGGGARGLSSLIILEALHKKVVEREELYDRLEDEDHPSNDARYALPCLYFDYVVGASTGALPAIMLGRLRMSTRNILLEYKTFGQSAFRKRRRYRFFHINRYSHKDLDAALLKLLNNHRKDDDEQTRPDRLHLAQPTHLQDECRTALFSVKQSQDADQAHLFRSYHSQPCTSSSLQLNATSRRPFNPGDNSPVWIHQAAKAAVSTPFFFHETEINGIRFIDGGVRFNNPTFEAYWEATKSHQHRKAPFQCDPETEPVGVIVSLGSGKNKRWKTSKKRQYIHRAFANARRKVFDHLSDPEPIHDQMREQAEHLDIPYFRFEVEHDLDNIDMDSWTEDTIHKIETATRTYLDLDKTVRELSRCAEYMVAFRRGRTAVTERNNHRGAQNGNGAPPGPRRGPLRDSRELGLFTQRRNHATGHAGNLWNNQPTFRPPPRAQTLPPENLYASQQNQWQHNTIPEYPQEMMTPPPLIDHPGVPELADHRQDRLEAADSFLPTMSRAYTMPDVPARAYRVSHTNFQT